MKKYHYHIILLLLLLINYITITLYSFIVQAIPVNEAVKNHFFNKLQYIML